MIEMFTGDITEGIADTGVKAAFLKCAIDSKGLTGGVERDHACSGQDPPTDGRTHHGAHPSGLPRPGWTSSR